MNNELKTELQAEIKRAIVEELREPDSYGKRFLDRVHETIRGNYGDNDSGEFVYVDEDDEEFVITEEVEALIVTACQKVWDATEGL